MPNYMNPLDQSAMTQQVLDDKRRNPRFEDVAPQNQMRPIPSDTLWKAGTGIQKHFPAMGESLRKIGGGLRLEPKDYVSSAIEGASLVQTPATPAIVMARQAENVGKQQLGAAAGTRSYFRTPEQMDRMTNEQLATAIMEGRDFKRTLAENTLGRNAMIEPRLHDKTVELLRKNADRARQDKLLYNTRQIDNVLRAIQPDFPNTPYLDAVAQHNKLAAIRKGVEQAEESASDINQAIGRTALSLQNSVVPGSTTSMVNDMTDEQNAAVRDTLKNVGRTAIDPYHSFRNMYQDPLNNR